MARKLIVEIIGDSKSLERSFARSSAASKKFGRDIEHAGRGALIGVGSFGRFNRMLANTAGVTLGAAGVVAGISATVNAASDLNEEVNKSAVVFGKQGKAMLSWSQDSATALGLSQQQALAAAGAFGAMFETSGLAEGQAASMSRTMVKLAADMASFNNEDPGDMLDRLRSGLAGEAEPLRRFGVLLSEARVKTEAVRLGLAASGATLTEQQKVQARYSLVLRDTARQQGDFARTSGGLANQMRVLRANVTNTAAVIGKAFLPVVLDATKKLNKFFSDPENQRIIQERAEKTATAFEHVGHRVGIAASLLSGLNKNAEAFDKSVGLALLSPLRLIPPVNDAFESLRDSMRGVSSEAVAMGLSFAAAAKEGLSLKRIQGTAATAPAGRSVTIPGSVSGTARRVLPGGATADLPFRNFQLAIAEATQQRKDDEQVLRVIVAALRQRLGRASTLAAKTEIQQALNQYQGQLSTLLEQDAADVKDAAGKIKAARQNARDAAKDALANLSSALAEQVSALREQARRIREEDIARRSRFETPLKLQLAAARASATPGDQDDRAVAAKVADAARKALKSGNLLMQGQIDAWNTLADALSGLNKESGTATQGHKQSVSALAANLGLARDKRLELEARLSRRSLIGTVPNQGTGAFGQPITVVFNHTTKVDSDVLERTVTKHQQVRKRRNPTQKRGPHGI